MLCLFCSQADRQIIMNGTPLHCACSWNETQRSKNSCGAIHLNVGWDTQGFEKKSAYASFHLETGTGLGTGLDNQEFSVVNVLRGPTDAQQDKIKEEAKQLCCNAPEIVVINIKS